jgi:hypothetical protein
MITFMNFDKTLFHSFSTAVAHTMTNPVRLLNRGRTLKITLNSKYHFRSAVQPRQTEEYRQPALL